MHFFLHLVQPLMVEGIKFPSFVDIAAYFVAQLLH